MNDILQRQVDRLCLVDNTRDGEYTDIVEVQRSEAYMDDTRHLKSFAVSPTVLGDLFRTGAHLHFTVGEGIPPDAKLFVAVPQDTGHHGTYVGNYLLVYEHPSFPEYVPGTIVPPNPIIITHHACCCGAYDSYTPPWRLS